MLEFEKRNQRTTKVNYQPAISRWIATKLKGNGKRKMSDQQSHYPGKVTHGAVAINREMSQAFLWGENNLVKGRLCLLLTLKNTGNGGFREKGLTKM